MFFIFSILIFFIFFIFFQPLNFGILGVIFFLINYFFFYRFRVIKIKKIKILFIFLRIWLCYILIKCSELKILNFYLFFFIIFFMVFSIKKILFFFIFFELRLVPTYFLVIKGSTPERTLAGNYLILYTFLGSLPLFFGVLKILNIKRRKFYFFFLKLKLGFFYFFIMAFLIKLPIFFCHLWLPKAHVEASTEGSMILAGLLLKLGGYGLFLFNKKFKIKIFLSNFVIIGGIIAGLFSLLQIDLKRFIAYSSIIHMRFIVKGRFYLIGIRLIGLIFMSVGHGFISAGMFYIVSLIYKFTRSRNIYFLNRKLRKNFFLFFFCGLCLIFKSSAPIRIKFFGELFLFIGKRVLIKFWKLVLVIFVKILGGVISVYFFLLMFHGRKKSFFLQVKFKQIRVIFILSLFSFIFFPLVNLF